MTAVATDQDRRIFTEREENALIELYKSNLGFEAVNSENPREMMFSKLESIGLFEIRSASVNNSILYYLTPEGRAYARELAA